MGRFEKYLYLLTDLVALNSAIFIASLLRFNELEKFGQTNYQYLLIIMNLLCVAVFMLFGFRTETRRSLTADIFKEMGKQWLVYALSLFAVIALLKGHGYSRSFVLIELFVYFAIATILRMVLTAAIKEYRRQGHNHKRIVVIGTNDTASEFVEEIKSNPHYGYRISGLFGDGVLTDHKKSDTDDIFNYLEENKIDEVYLSVPSIDETCDQLLHFCDMRDIQVKVLNSTIRDLNQRARSMKIDTTGHIPIVTLVNRSSEMRFSLVAKRAFDILFSLTVITLVFSWLFPIIALLIKATSRGPVFFVQQRTGINNQTFKCLKFRTMFVNGEANSKQASDNDPRITAIGRILRKNDLDELPQFINVLLGDMSTVGPRPHMLAHTLHYGNRVNAYMQRHWIKPGITGLAQIQGFRGETRTIQAMEDRVKWDRIYVRSSDIALDTRIIARTALNMVMLHHRGN